MESNGGCQGVTLKMRYSQFQQPFYLTDATFFQTHNLQLVQYFCANLKTQKHIIHANRLFHHNSFYPSPLPKDFRYTCDGLNNKSDYAKHKLEFELRVCRHTKFGGDVGTQVEAI